MANLKGKIIKVLQMESGESKNGTWKKQNLIIETDDKYPKKNCVEFWNDLSESVFKVGSEIDIEVNFESREFNDKWFTSIKAWKIISNKSESF